MSKARSPVSNVVYVFRGEEIIKKFSAETATENAKNPMQQAKIFLNGILADVTHEMYDDLTSGKMSTLSGHPEVIKPRQALMV